MIGLDYISQFYSIVWFLAFVTMQAGDHPVIASGDRAITRSGDR